MHEVTGCQICGHEPLTPMLDLGMQPLSEKLGDSTLYPLTLMRCGNCDLVQLDHIVDQRIVFPPNHPYATGNTKALREHYATLARELSWRTSPCRGRLAVDIGANDGTFLQELQNSAGDEGLAIEPTNQSRKARDKRINTMQVFWTRDVAQEIERSHGKAKLITAMNVLAHVPDPHDFMDGVTDLLADDGVFLTENHDLLAITEGMQFDTIYHEHLRYYSLASLSRLLSMHGMQVTTADPIPTHGGSTRVWARKETPDLGTRAIHVASRLNALLCDLTADGAKVYGVAATTRATPLIHFTKIATYITMICETPSSQKIGHTLPGTAIPIVDERFLIKDQPEYALLLAWHIAGDLISRLKTQGYKGKFIVPLPVPVVIDGDRFEDERGVIQDLLGGVDGVTEIFTREGAIRGNHIHHQTEQWTYIVEGTMLAAQGLPGEAEHRLLVTRDLLHEPAGIPHAWKAMEDTWVLVFTKGPRSGENYESDTDRLPEEQRLL